MVFTRHIRYRITITNALEKVCIGICGILYFQNIYYFMNSMLNYFHVIIIYFVQEHIPYVLRILLICVVVCADYNVPLHNTSRVNGLFTLQVEMF